MKDNSPSQNGPALADDQIALLIWQTVSTSPNRSVPTKTLLEELDITPLRLRELVDSLNSLTDSATGARPYFSFESEMLVLEGSAGALDFDALSPEAERMLASISRSDGSSSSAATPAPVESDIFYGPFFHALSEAIEDGVRCTITYRAAYETSAQPRRIDPLAFVVEDHVAYLDTWDIEKDAQRRYRLDRIQHVEFSEESIEFHPYRATSLHQSLLGAPNTALVSLPTRFYFDQLKWVGARPVEPGTRPVPEGVILVEVSYKTEAWLFDQLLSHPAEIILLEPASLRCRFRSYAQQLLSCI